MNLKMKIEGLIESPSNFFLFFSARVVVLVRLLIFYRKFYFTIKYIGLRQKRDYRQRKHHDYRQYHPNDFVITREPQVSRLRLLLSEGPKYLG